MYRYFTLNISSLLKVIKIKRKEYHLISFFVSHLTQGNKLTLYCEQDAIQMFFLHSDI